MCATRSLAQLGLWSQQTHTLRVRPHAGEVAKNTESGFAALFVLQLERKFGSFVIVLFL